MTNPGTETVAPVYEPFRVVPGGGFRLSSIDPGSVPAGIDESAARERVRENRKQLAGLQEVLYAEGRQSLLLVLQAMDTAGKDSTIRQVMKGVNPQGCTVTSFKAPTSVELSRDFLWRVHRRVPPRGTIGIFNRSHYEDVLVVKVRHLVPDALIEKRYAQILDFERLLTDHGTRILKVMLHISKEYQRRRLVRRLERPDKHWKFNPGDLRERARWDEYMQAYEDAVNRCSTDASPWHVVPSEKRWFRNLVITELLVDTLTDMSPQYPPRDFDPADYPPASIV